MSTTELRSIGSLISGRRAAANTAVTAGGGGDNAAVTGVTIDRAALGYPDSAVFIVTYSATLAQGATLSIAHTVQGSEAANMASPATIDSRGATVVATGPVGGGTVTGEVEIDVSLRGAGRYVRLNFTPDLSAANTDTAALAAVAVFGGASRLPQ